MATFEPTQVGHRYCWYNADCHAYVGNKNAPCMLPEFLFCEVLRWGNALQTGMYRGFDTRESALEALESAINKIRGGEPADVAYVARVCPSGRWSFYSRAALREHESHRLVDGELAIIPAVLPDDLYAALDVPDGNFYCHAKTWTNMHDAKNALAKAQEKIASKPEPKPEHAYKPYHYMASVPREAHRFFSPAITARKNELLHPEWVAAATLPQDVFDALAGKMLYTDMKVFDDEGNALKALEDALAKVQKKAEEPAGLPDYRLINGNRHKPEHTSAGWLWTRAEYGDDHKVGVSCLPFDVFMLLPDERCKYTIGLARMYASEEDALYGLDGAWVAYEKRRQVTAAQGDLQSRYDKLLKENLAMLRMLQDVINTAAFAGESYACYLVNDEVVRDIDNFLKLPLEERWTAT